MEVNGKLMEVSKISNLTLKHKRQSSSRKLNIMPSRYDDVDCSVPKQKGQTVERLLWRVWQT